MRRARNFRKLAEVLPVIHDTPVSATDRVQTFRPYRPESWDPPAWLRDQKLWDRALEVFHGPRFQQLDMSLGKTFNLTERVHLKFSVQAQNVLNHPSFDCIDSNLASGTFGKAQCLAQFGASGQGSSLGAPAARIMSVVLKLSF